MTDANKLAGTESPDYIWVASQFSEAMAAIDKGPEGQGLLTPTTERVQAALGSATYDQVHGMLFQSALTAADARSRGEAAEADSKPPIDQRVAIMAHHAIFSYAQAAYPEQTAANGELHVVVTEAFRRVAAGIDRIVIKPQE